MAKITGVGGIFFKSPDQQKLKAWYRDVLGIAIESMGAALLSYEAPGHPPFLVWSPFESETTYFAPSSREFMVNFAVDDLDGFLAAIAAKGVTVLGRQEFSYGDFAWIVDPDGTKIEFWQPKG